MTRRDYLKIGIVILFFVGIFGFGSFTLPYIEMLAGGELPAEVIGNIQDSGILGVFYFLAIQVYQIIIFIVPGEVVEVAAGMIYGTIWGAVICSVGVMIGVGIIYGIVRFIGYDTIASVVPIEKFKDLSFIQNKKRLELLIFILYLVPGTPKDGLTYIAPFLDLPMRRFLLISMIARLPSIISSTYAGSLISEGEAVMSIVVFVIIGITAIIGILINKKLQEYLIKRKESKK